MKERQEGGRVVERKSENEGEGGRVVEKKSEKKRKKEKQQPNIFHSLTSPSRCKDADTFPNSTKHLESCPAVISSCALQTLRSI